MIGILTEKPSAAKNFATALNAKSVAKGIYGGNYNSEDFYIVHSVGHIFEFVPPENMVDPSRADVYKKWALDRLPWNESDFSWKRQLQADKKDVFKTIQSVLKGCDEIVIATDNDPSGEGDLLAWEILLAGGFKPVKWSRMYFEDESEKSLQKAFVARKPLSGVDGSREYAKGYYRARWDFLSMQFTRVATLVGDGRSVLREGRLKSAMVLMCGDALKAVSEYKKIPFYQNRFKD